ncbi:MAG TPA: PaaI family thioesterase [Ktedonobacterales bacterium]|nr:PaaI family thioesterase [Ktedonobacterales bacterium]
MTDPQPPASPLDGADERMLNDRSGYQACFGCGARNADGLQLVFHREGNEIWAEHTPDERFQGFPGVLHGGVIATMLDETLSRAAVFAGKWMMTARLEIRYRRAAPVGRALRVTARPTQVRARMVSARGEVRLADEPEIVLAEAEGVFLPIAAEYEREMISQRPELAGFFERE